VRRKMTWPLVSDGVGGELLFKLLQRADKSLDSESANGICST